MRTSTRLRLPLSVPLLLVLLLALTACGDPTDDTGAAPSDPVPSTVDLPPADATAVPVPSTAPATPGATAPPSVQPSAAPSPADGTVPATVYFVRDNDSGLWVEPVERDVVGPAVAGAALAAMTDQPPAGLDRAVPEGTVINGVDIDPDGVLTVDYTFPDGAGLGAAFEQALIDAVVLTATQFDGVERVRFLVDGSQPETLFGHVEVSEPVEPDPFAVSPIVVTEAVGISGSGAGGGSIELTGTANVFEATLELELLDTGGNVIESTFTTASCGTGCRGDWTHAFTDLEPDTYTVVVRETDPSDGEGRPPFAVELPVVVP